METKPKILLVDDEADIIDVLKFLLRREGFSVFTAVDGQDALEKIRKERFAGVVCDLSMPKMDGLTLLRTLRAQNNFLPFLFLSGHAREEHAHEMMNFGAIKVLQKPHVDSIPKDLHALIELNKELGSLEASGEDAIEFLEILHGKVG